MLTTGRGVTDSDKLRGKRRQSLLREEPAATDVDWLDQSE